MHVRLIQLELAIRRRYRGRTLKMLISHFQLKGDFHLIHHYLLPPTEDSLQIIS